ncbi:MAG: CRISPR-associated helicase Cas3', partial [Ignavibacteriales bacterium UTCHB3]
EQLTLLNRNDLELISELIEALIGIQTDLKYLVENINVFQLNDSTDITMSSVEFEDLDITSQLEYYLLGLSIISILLYSDKKDVILKEMDVTPEPLPQNLIENYREKQHFGKSTAFLDRKKDEAFFGVIINLEKLFNPEKRFYSITLPTGMGKTITSFKAALKIAELAGGERRLIFTIPFTSIIDQTHTIYGEIIGSDDSRFMIKHHHLAEPVYKTGDDTLGAEKSEFLIETWESSVIVTTFVQLFGSLITNSKSRLLKLPNLAHSVIVLDEVQNIPYEHWELINNVLKAFAKVYDIYFILLTATQPLIFEPEKEITELVPDYKSFFRLFNRTKVQSLLNNPFETVEDLGEHLLNYAAEHQQKDIMAILNTKAGSAELFEFIANNLPDENIYYLSTSVSPYERKIIINEKIKKDKSGVRKILITTQLVEAGVDISFDTVFREIAPIDSILQAAGRANRYNENKEPADVFIFQFNSSADLSAKVYGTALISASKELIKKFISDNIEGLTEEKFLDLITAYFDDLKNRADNLNSEVLQNIRELNYQKVGEFNLIEEVGNPVSVFLFLNEEARSLWMQFKKIIMSEKHSYEKKREFSSIKAKFYDYVISVSVRESDRISIFNREPEFGFQIWDPQSGDNFYSYSPDDFKFNRGFIKHSSFVL